MKTFFKQLVALALALGFVAAAGAWQGPAQEPPAGNVAAPVNVSSGAQSKQGTLGVGGLGVFGRAFVSPAAGYALPANLQLGVNGAVGASQYCDQNGQNCSAAAGNIGWAPFKSLSSLSGAGVPAPGSSYSLAIQIQNGVSYVHQGTVGWSDLSPDQICASGGYSIALGTCQSDVPISPGSKTLGALASHNIFTLNGQRYWSYACLYGETYVQSDTVVYSAQPTSILCAR